MLARPDTTPPSTTELESLLGSGWIVAVATSPLSETDLTAGERDAYDALAPDGPRRVEWLTGRAALRAVLARMGWDRDTSRLTVPNPRVALSHCGSAALAVASVLDGAGGVGVDLEILRRTPPDIDRFFMRRKEITAVARAGRPVDDVSTLRLWTVKEAVFKADLANRGGQLYDYVLDDARRWAGTATKVSDPTSRFRYQTVQTAGHLVSVARRTEREL